MSVNQSNLLFSFQNPWDWRLSTCEQGVESEEEKGSASSFFSLSLPKIALPPDCTFLCFQGNGVHSKLCSLVEEGVWMIRVWSVIIFVQPFPHKHSSLLNMHFLYLKWDIHFPCTVSSTTSDFTTMKKNKSCVFQIINKLYFLIIS